MQRFRKYLFLATAIFIMNTCGVIPVCFGSERNPENYLKLTHLDTQSFGEAVCPDPIHNSCKAVISASENTLALISNDHALRVFDRDSDTGALSNMRVAKHSSSNPIGITQPRTVAISPQGEHVYVACYSDPLVSFEVTPTELNKIDEGGNNGEKDVSISSDGKYVYTIYPKARRPACQTGTIM